MKTKTNLKKKMLLIISSILFIFIVCKSSNENNVFIAGESISYDLYYNWGFIWIHAGHANFSAMHTEYKNEPCYYLSATGKSLKSFEKFYVVRDTFISIVDKKNFLPKYHKRVVREDKYWAQDEYWFTNIGNDKVSVITDCQRKKGRNIDTLTFHNSVTDLVTAIYKVRNYDFDNVKKNQKIPFSIVIDDDDEQFNLTLTYLGKEKIELHNGQIYNCIKLRPKLIKGNVFKDEDAMTMWITDDKNRIPVMIETKIRVGSLKVMLKSANNTKYPISSLVKK